MQTDPLTDHKLL